MATNSIMKDYVRRQLRYWVDELKDGMLPRDFMTKSFTKTQLVLPNIHLKPHRVAAVLHLPSPLLVTTVHCIELTIAVPSWTDADKEAAHKPVLIHINELLVQVHNICECSGELRRVAEERVQAALLEPDPLGSTAAMFEFARDVNDRTKLVVDKLRVQIFIGGVSRVELVLTDFNARTADALWQDVRDPTTCVEYSPDHLVQTRFQVMSFLLSAGVNGGSVEGAINGAQTVRLLTKVSVVIRVTRFYNRSNIADSWRRQMQLVDVNFGAVKVELGVAELIEVYSIASTLCNWILNSRSSVSTPADGMAADRELIGACASGNDQPNIELQITFRGTIEAKLKFTSSTEGPQELFLVADRAAGSVIFHRHGARELQMSLHELAVRFRGYVVFRLKPDREVFHLEERLDSLSIKWRVQSVLCRIDDDLATVLTEMYRLVSDKEQAIVIRCGTCHQQISLDMIDVHVCPPHNSNKSLPATPLAGQGICRNRFSEAANAENSTLETDEEVGKTTRVNGPPKAHVVLQMNELEVQTGSRLVLILLKLFGVRGAEEIMGREVTTKFSNLRLTTESNEFAGDSIFVPALPLAFQMLECSLQGCGCVLRRKETADYQSASPGTFHGYNLPTHVFLDITHCTITSQECFVKADKIQIRSRFSDGSRVCSSSQPQLSFHVNVDKIRCQVDDVFFKLTRRVVEHIGGSTGSKINSLMMTLFLGVLQIRAIEFTLQNEGTAEARAKSLLKQAIVVFDNQLGFLCTQSSLDFKTIINSQTMKFVHRKTPASPTTEVTPLIPPELEREDASRCIQRMVRRKQLIRQQEQRFEADDYEPGVPDDGNGDSPTRSPLKVSLGIPSPIMVLGPDSDLIGDIRGGLTKFMSPLSRTRRSSDSIRDGINKLMSPISRTLTPSSSLRPRPSVESVAPLVEIAAYSVTVTEARRHEDERSLSKKSQELRLNELSEEKLAALPDVVRVLVQIGGCRLCVPINPREKINYLCREIVRRYNESFAADRDSISAVSLQDKHGGVFSPSDTIGFTLSVAPSELLFAYPHEHNGQIRSLARLAAGSSRTTRSRNLQDPNTPQQSITRERVLYSKLPLPLAIALLANESERDLIRSGLCERASDGEAWPDLALNAASLDADRNPLIVEIAWHEACIEVTNGDAFALCRQLLGLCTSRVPSKYVGKILRTRLIVNSSNPLVEWACRRKTAMHREADVDSSAQPSDQDNASYDQLKKIIQDTYGVYTR
ncbi:uncharacterized protein PITG_03870 [Phytophthora infestans T30-4]|uniref:Uncharacterized protein n=1 Tax=Phytophthora infestans (strain T30-4) TaxID=403677 RepID=D0MYR2_PHYIT|nr:uncharacterized protein PITG_03870 [Phytophthora infestans T30-4]EEY66310.1 conserved hypothetical protein [Phytophthora infestans T30-4]|eukprot:XP_002906909.1 conserved hypothetical protein [Phytophthora infestans T30-4]